MESSVPSVTLTSFKRTTIKLLINAKHGPGNPGISNTGLEPLHLSMSFVPMFPVYVNFTLIC